MERENLQRDDEGLQPIVRVERCLCGGGKRGVDLGVLCGQISATAAGGLVRVESGRDALRGCMSKVRQTLETRQDLR